MIEWSKKSFIYNENLIREMFHLIYRQYNSLGEVAECLRKTYVIAETSIKDVKCLLHSLSTVRNLLYVQMSPFEEEIMRCCLNEIMDNKIFFQHPDLMRALCVHETGNFISFYMKFLRSARRMLSNEVSHDIIPKMSISPFHLKIGM